MICWWRIEKILVDRPFLIAWWWFSMANCECHNQMIIFLLSSFVVISFHPSLEIWRTWFSFNGLYLKIPVKMVLKQKGVVYTMVLKLQSPWTWINDRPPKTDGDGSDGFIHLKKHYYLKCSQVCAKRTKCLSVFWTIYIYYIQYYTITITYLGDKNLNCSMCLIPSGNLHNYGTSAFFMGKSTINGHVQ